VRHDFKAVINAAVVLSVSSSVSGLENLAGIVVVLAALVNLKLYTKTKIARAVENRFGLVIIGVDRLVLPFIIARAAIGIIIIVVIVGVVGMNNAPAILTACVVVVIASLA
jgi:hypothetical protein